MMMIKHRGETTMTTKRKKFAMGLFLGSMLATWSMGMTIIFPPEACLLDKTVHRSLKVPSTEYDQIRVIKQNAELRIKPKEETVVIKKLPLGALLDVEEEIGDWLKISLPPDEDDFVLTGYLHRAFTEKASVIHE
jgi:hypothetical protein